jgi:uncharacterized protein YihD (DUF1040 family)
MKEMARRMNASWSKPPRDPVRIDEMLELLGKLWKRHPDLRLGQLIFSLVNPSAPCSEIFNREDDKLKEAMLKRMEEPESIPRPPTNHP